MTRFRDEEPDVDEVPEDWRPLLYGDAENGGFDPFASPEPRRPRAPTTKTRRRG